MKPSSRFGARGSLAAAQKDALGVAQAPAQLEQKRAAAHARASGQRTAEHSGLLAGGKLRALLELYFSDVGGEVPGWMVSQGSAQPAAAIKENRRDTAASSPAAAQLFRGEKGDFNGIVEGLNNKLKLTLRKSYGFRSDLARKVALYHALAKLPEPQLTHSFF